MVFVKVGWHGGTGNGMTGIGDYFKALDDAKIPFCIKSVNNVGLTVEAAQYVRASGVLHNIILRWTNPGGARDDHPNTTNDPASEAAVHWAKVKANINNAPELAGFEDLIWIEPTNEIDTHTHAEWLGWFSYYLGLQAMADGYKTCISGHNAGQPEPEHWHLSGFRAFLELCSANPEKIAVSLHEGKLGDMLEPPESYYPHLIGRFTWLYDACAEMGISRPTTFISEWAWSYNDMPSEVQALEEIKWLSELVANYEAVRGVFLWNLSGGDQWGNLPNKLQKLIQPVTQYALTTRFPDPEIPPVEIPPAEIEHTIHLLPQDTTLQELQAVTDHLHDDRSAFTYSADVAHAVTYVGTNKSKVVIWDGHRWQDDIYAWFVVRGINHESRSFDEIIDGQDPLEGLEIGPLFSVPFVLVKPGGVFGALRDYANGKHEGIDLDILTHEIDSKQSMLACFDGMVTFSGNVGSAYGEYIIIQSTYKGAVFNLWYCHLDKRYVLDGNEVFRGQEIAELGDTGGDWGEHVHLNLQEQQTGLDGYVVEKVRDPYPFMQMISIPEPPIQGNSQIGLHASADPGDLSDAEIAEFEALQPGMIKVLSAHSDSSIMRLMNDHPDALWVVRAFLSFWENGKPRDVSPQQFFDWTFPDVQRSLNALHGKDIVVELHNEPNLNLEGLGGSWFDGAGFASWWKAILALYRQALPDTKFIYPGLSPGIVLSGDIQRIQYEQFLEDSRFAIEAADGLGCHAYWADAMQEALNVVDTHIQMFPNIPIWVTEASNNLGASPDKMAQDYVEFHNSLKARVPIQGVTFFVASASNPNFANEVWVGKNIGAKVRQIIGANV